jgi:hypothetical protein
MVGVETLQINSDLGIPKQPNSPTQSNTTHSKTAGETQSITKLLSSLAIYFCLHHKEKQGHLLLHQIAKLTNYHPVPKPAAVHR